MPAVNEIFQTAPMGRQVIGASIFTFVILASTVGFTGAIAARKLPSHSSLSAKMLPVLPPVGVVLVSGVLFLRERSKVAQFRIQDDELVLGKKRYPLHGLLEVNRDPDVLKRARKVWGNGGLGSIRGTFKSQRLGKFEAFLTGTENAVVLRWPDKAVAVSPMDPEFFILSAQAAAGLRRA